MTKLRILSNNIWYCDNNNAVWKESGADCSSEYRSPGFFRVYEETAPDIIGLQECSAKMANLLMSRFAEKQMPYALLWGKDTPILYRRDKFLLVDSDSFIYSENVPNYEGCFNNDKTKSYCIAVFELKENGKKLIFATTHLWWKSSEPADKNYQPYSDEARAYQMGVLLDRLDVLQQKYNCPVVVVGDFNAVYDSMAVQTAFSRGYIHAHDVASEYADETMGMHYCYADGYDTKPYPKDFSASIDHILIRNVTDSFVHRFERYTPEYYMPLSDHFPVWVDVQL